MLVTLALRDIKSNFEKNYWVLLVAYPLAVEYAKFGDFWAQNT